MATEISDTPLLIIMFTIVVVFHKIIPFLFKKTGIKKTDIPGLVGWIILGIILAYPLIGDTSIARFLKIDHVPEHKGDLHDIIDIISDFGVALLIFSAGLKISIKDMISVGKTALPVAFFGAVIPFIFGLAYIIIIQPHDNLNRALFLAASMVATSICATVSIVKSLRLFHTKEAKIITSAAVIDDILGMIALAAACYGAESGQNLDAITLLRAAALIIITIALSIYFIIPWIQKNIRKKSIKLISIIFSISFCAILAYATKTLHLSLIIGAFMAGSILSKHAETWELDKKIEPFADFLLPFFFICVGLHVNICINIDILSTIVIVFVLAVIGKYLGCLMGAKIFDKSMSTASARIIGVGMIPRGEVGIMVASIGLKAGAIPNELYTAVIFMCVLTTVIAPPVLSILLKKKYGDNMKPEG